MPAPAPTEAQLTYIKRLCDKLGLTHDQALASAGLSGPLDIATAGTLIDYLKGRLERADGGEPRPAPATTAGRLTATELRLIASGLLAPPEVLDEDAAWILHRLAKLAGVEQALDQPVRWPGANQGGPITAAHLVAYFGSPDAAAHAFKVTAPTLRNWEAAIPAARIFEAAWLTRGYVQPPSA